MARRNRMGYGNKRLLPGIGLCIGCILLGAVLLPGLGQERVRGRTNEERVEFLRSLGWEVNAVPVSEQIILLPRAFPEVLKKYNELQKDQGFDLEKYAGKEVTMYTYALSGTEEERYCVLYVCKNRIIGGDIHSNAMDGRMEKLR